MTTRKSGFDAPVYGTVLPSNKKLKKNPDGTVSAVPVKKSTKKTKK